MRISDLIKQLEETKKLHGDREVVLDDFYGDNYYPEIGGCYITGNGKFVISFDDEKYREAVGPK